ncbi:MAG: LysR family transcriptional regulator [Hyphomicrobiales bacterium]|nr:LysR family transcriptional regulator [Hyphomicrobiales bacterium]MCP5000425.1 LysR family transcriptional regulator [Hyphomicrobiales bacterium]
MNAWDDYRIILALERSGSVRGAAQALSVNHATVSRRLAALNRRLDAAVFERIEGRYRATAQGKPLVAGALRMEEAAYAAEREMAGLDQSMSGRLTLSLPDVVAKCLLMEDLGRFCHEHPDIELVLHTSHSFADLDRREADLVLRISNHPPDHLVGRRLFKYARSCYCAPHYLANTAFARLRWLGWPDDADRPEWVQETVFPDVPVGMRIEDPMVRHAAALAGHGLIFDACFVADRAAGLVRVPGALPILDRDIWVLTHPDMKAAPKVAVLFRFLVEAISLKRGLIEGRPATA